jgi:uncharacterized protein YebE (UPF0316 family)
MVEIIQSLPMWVIPILIFCARIVDVSIGTLRIVFLSRGLKVLAPICGFFEVLIWLVVIGYVMQNLDHWYNLIAYALGFAVGNYVGLQIEEALAMGFLSVWIVTTEDAQGLLNKLDREHFGTTVVGARGARGKVRIIIAIIRRKQLPKLVRMVRKSNPQAFLTVQDIRTVRGGVFPYRGHAARREHLLADVIRKGR